MPPVGCMQTGWLCEGEDPDAQAAQWGVSTTSTSATGTPITKVQIYHGEYVSLLVVATHVVVRSMIGCQCTQCQDSKVMHIGVS